MVKPLRRRLTALERRTIPAPGQLPIALVLRPDAPEAERLQVMDEYRRRTAAGQQVLLAQSHDDAMTALIDAMEPV